MFTRSPESGVKRASAEVYLGDPSVKLPLHSLQQSFPQAAQQLLERTSTLEAQLRDAVQVDFRYAQNELQLGEPKPLSRSPQAALSIAVSLAQEGVLSQQEALLRVNPEEIRLLLLPTFEGSEVRQALRLNRLLAQGKGIGGGVCSGQVAFDLAGTLQLHQAGRRVILVCPQLTYRERDALDLVSGVVVTGGPTLAARHYERPCVVAPKFTVAAGDTVSLDAVTGQIFEGALEMSPGELTGDARTLLEWADATRKLEIRANISSLAEAQQASAFGATGIGLCRIESLFQVPTRLPLFQKSLREICLFGSQVSNNLDRLTGELEQEVYALLAAAARGPFAIRLLDAPLSQMLRHWRDSGQLPEDFFQGNLLAWLDELNPMQGLRCGRLSILFPALMRIQLRAILRAWRRAPGVRLQVMMPGVCDVQELRILRQQVQEICLQEKIKVPEVGSMLEVPRACLTADVLGQEANFLSFGTGDLTESTCGISRYDSQLSFLPGYLEKGMFGRDPFEAIDQTGVGALMRLALELVKAKCPSVEMGICGAQVVDPQSLEFCIRLGLNYISVPVRHLPVARLAAAQAALQT